MHSCPQRRRFQGSANQSPPQTPTALEDCSPRSACSCFPVPLAGVGTAALRGLHTAEGSCLRLVAAASLLYRLRPCSSWYRCSPRLLPCEPGTSLQKASAAVAVLRLALACVWSLSTAFATPITSQSRRRTRPAQARRRPAQASPPPCGLEWPGA